MTPFVYDTNIFVYAVGTAHPLRDPCRAILARARSGRLDGHASPDLLQEFVHQRTRRTGDRVAACGLARDVAQLCAIDDLGRADALLGLDLYERHDRLSSRDAVFAAFALNRGIAHLLSADDDLDGIDGLLRIDPRDGPAIDGLSG